MLQETGIPFEMSKFMSGLLMIGRQLEPPDSDKSVDSSNEPRKAEKVC